MSSVLDMILEEYKMAEIKFEEGYLFRNNRAITSSPDIALTELVANAWDAGALKVDITLPYADMSVG